MAVNRDTIVKGTHTLVCFVMQTTEMQQADGQKLSEFDTKKCKNVYNVEVIGTVLYGTTKEICANS